ncbi:unnamed protein product [Camellia sinensis]
MLSSVPMWTGLLYLGLRSKLRFAWTALPGFGAWRFWLAFTAFSVGRRLWSRFIWKGKDGSLVAATAQLVESGGDISLPCDGVKMNESYEVNSRGVEIFTKSWLPKTCPPKAIIYYCHGYGDACTFLAEGIARKLVFSGYGVFAMDYPGFGLSEGLHGYIPSFDILVDDVIEQYSKTKANYDGNRFITIQDGVWKQTGRVTTKSDVYSFGVILMELITGRKALDQTQKEESVHLVTWFRRMHNKDTFRKAIDPTIDLDEETVASVSTVAELAGHCCARASSQRPDMGHAVNVLSSLTELWKPSDPDADDIYGIDFDMTLPQAVKKWQALATSSSALLGSGDNSQSVI